MGKPPLPRENPYGGLITPEQWYEAEHNIDLNLPDFEHEPVPYVRLVLGGIGKIISHYHNTEVWKYDSEEWQNYSHIRIEDEEQYPYPIQYFRDTLTFPDEAERWQNMARAMMEKDFKLVLPKKRPTPDVMEMYWMGARGEEPIEEIILRIQSDGTEQHYEILGMGIGLEMERNPYNPEARGAGKYWVALAIGITAVDACAEETFSNGFRRAIESDNLLIKLGTLASIPIMAGHLLDIVPERWDAVDRLGQGLATVRDKIGEWTVRGAHIP